MLSYFSSLFGIGSIVIALREACSFTLCVDRTWLGVFVQAWPRNLEEIGKPMVVWRWFVVVGGEPTTDRTAIREVSSRFPSSLFATVIHHRCHVDCLGV